MSTHREKPNVKFTGYAIEMRVPLRGKIPDVVANHAMVPCANRLCDYHAALDTAVRRA